MYEFEMENGVKIQITGNHKMLTDRGWICAQDIEETDNIYSYHSSSIS
jgi:intein/homing endonuclease